MEEEEEQNTMAMVSIGAGGVAIIAHLLQCCLGIIPFVGMLILPVILIADIVAIVTGVMGFRASAESGQGKEMSIGGIVIGALSLLFYFGLCGLSVVALIVSALSGGY